jgi:peptidoglycan L-alanyl-D-glutamate endopeptidase CwlK
MKNEFSFGSKSRAEMHKMHPDLIKVLNLAIERTEQDFTIFDGFRTAADQNQLFRRGASQIDGYRRKGKHQIQSDGYCHAADLVPWINGRAVWDWDAIYVIADAVVSSARELDVQLRWGGCWQHINPLSGSPEHWVAEYVKRKRSQGKRAFNDGPHWELYGYL